MGGNTPAPSVLALPAADLAGRSTSVGECRVVILPTRATRLGFTLIYFYCCWFTVLPPGFAIKGEAKGTVCECLRRESQRAKLVNAVTGFGSV